MGRDDDRQRYQNEEDERERNRRAVMERKRQWEVADSENDASDDGGGDGSSDKRKHRRSRSRSPSRSDDDSRDGRRHSKKHKKKHHRRRSRSRSRSSSRSDDGDDSREHSRRHKKDKKRHKHKHHKSSRDRKKRRHKDSSSSKKHKKEQSSRGRSSERHQDDDASYSSSSLSDNEREILEKGTRQQSGMNTLCSSAAAFGKYGIISYPSDFHKESIRRSFEIWLAEVKAIPSFNGSKHELMEYFKEYAEDFNTGTMPHEKYYNYDKWEMEEYERKKREAAAKASGGTETHNTSIALDEFQHREQMAQRAKQKKLEELKRVQQSMTAEKREEMKNQARLKHELAVAYKTGDEEARKRLQKRLEPEEK
jgi:hypothetical protein